MGWGRENSLASFTLGIRAEKSLQIPPQRLSGAKARTKRLRKSGPLRKKTELGTECINRRMRITENNREAFDSRESLWIT